MFDLTNHKKLWNWLAENPLENKAAWPEWRMNGGEVDHVECLCFACDYCSACEGCPLIWPSNAPTCDLYHRWEAVSNKDLRKKIAREIANLEVREGVVCK